VARVRPLDVVSGSPPYDSVTTAGGPPREAQIVDVARVGRADAPSVSVIVMAYNEAGTVASVLREISETLAPSGLTYEVLVVDDGSDDGTGDIADEVAASVPEIHVLHHGVNRGIGEVYRTGFSAARGDYLTFLPADGQFPATIVTQFASLIPEADVVVGYFTDIRRSPAARVLSACERLLYRVMFGTLPRFKGIMMFRRTVLSDLHIEPSGRGWGVLMEIVVKASRAHFRIASVATPLRARQSGHSKVNNLRSVLANLRQALELRRSLNR
jgi:glycosyltransferase involved in cell wall biosynthesis